MEMERKHWRDQSKYRETNSKSIMMLINKTKKEIVSRKHSSFRL